MKGLVIAAGYGTRFLPATKTVPKEMLPLITKPSIAFIVEEFMAAGIKDIVVLSSRRKKALDDFFDREPELEELFSREGNREKLKKITPYSANFSFLHQREMKGTGHALLQTRHLLEDGPFVVAYPDDLHFGSPPLARQLMDIHEETGASVMSTLHDPPDLNRYGILKIAPDGLHVEDVVEKPALGSEPSKEASIGRFLFTPDIFPLLQEGWEQHTGEGEYYHIYALKKLMDRGKVVYHQLQGERLDIGTPTGYFEAILRYASGVPELQAVLDRVSPQLQS